MAIQMKGSGRKTDEVNGLIKCKDILLTTDIGAVGLTLSIWLYSNEQQN